MHRKLTQRAFAYVVKSIPIYQSHQHLHLCTTPHVLLDIASRRLITAKDNLSWKHDTQMGVETSEGEGELRRQTQDEVSGLGIEGYLKTLLDSLSSSPQAAAEQVLQERPLCTELV